MPEIDWKPVRLPPQTYEHPEVFWYRTRPRWLPWQVYRWWKRLVTRRPSRGSRQEGGPLGGRDG